jgi:hypothetical protein
MSPVMARPPRVFETLHEYGDTAYDEHAKRAKSAGIGIGTLLAIRWWNVGDRQLVSVISVARSSGEAGA